MSVEYVTYMLFLEAGGALATSVAVGMPSITRSLALHTEDVAG